MTDLHALLDNAHDLLGADHSNVFMTAVAAGLGLLQPGEAVTEPEFKSVDYQLGFFYGVGMYSGALTAAQPVQHLDCCDLGRMMN